MSKILLLPLDERPCNYSFPIMMSEKCDDIELIIPPKNILGDKKQPADTGVLANWLRNNIGVCDYAVISIDMLIYGGIVPSRLHRLTEKECSARLSLINELHGLYPDVKIFAFNLIMRSPQYSCDEEEPDYYGSCGAEICRIGVLRDKRQQKILSSDEAAELENLEKSISADCLNDFSDRRKINHCLNMKIISLVKENIIDFLVIPMDDCAPYGWAASERREIRKNILNEKLIRRIYSYSGADEVGSILVARAVNKIRKCVPSIYICSSSVYGLMVTPEFEDRPLGENIKWQVSSAGGCTALSPDDADFILMVNAPTAGGYRMGYGNQNLSELDSSYGNCRCLPDFAEKLRRWREKKPVILADLALSNGADRECMEILSEENLIEGLYSYAAWNTDANAVGTCIAQGMICEGDCRKSSVFTTHRLIEDWLYMSIVRQNAEKYINNNNLCFDRGPDEESISNYVKTELNKIIKENKLPLKTEVINVSFPWHRLFEADIKISEII